MDFPLGWICEINLTDLGDAPSDISVDEDPQPRNQAGSVPLLSEVLCAMLNDFLKTSSLHKNVAGPQKQIT